MTKQIGKDAIDFLLDNNKINRYFDINEKPSIILEFIGGEALLEIDLIDYLTDYFKEQTAKKNHIWAFNHIISIGSNGVLYNTKKVQKYLDKNGKSVSVAITIDGNKKLHDSCRVFPDGSGSYDIVENSVKNAISRGMDMTKLTISPENIDFIYDAFINCWNLGIKMIYANCVFENVWDNNKHPKILYNQMKKIADYIIDNKLYDKYTTSLFFENIENEIDLDTNFCGGNGKMLAIGPDGICYPCLRFMPHSMVNNKNILSIGDIYKGIQDINENKNLCELCKITIRSQSPDKCLKCKISSGCGYCTAFNYDYFNDFNKRATFICEMHKARYLASIYYFNKLYRKLNIDNYIDLLLDYDDIFHIIDSNEYNNLILSCKEVINNES